MSADQGSAPARALRVQHAEAYRLHIIESVYPAHITGITMALLVAVVSKVRHPGAMLLVDDWPWSDFRGPFAVVAFILLWCTRHTPRAYVEHFESACGLVNWLGMLARMSAMRALPDLHWHFMRIIPIFACATGQRFEARKQWPWTVARHVVADAINAYVDVDAEEPVLFLRAGAVGADSFSSSIAYAGAIVRRFATHYVPGVAAHVGFNLAVQAACEANDARAFAKRVRRFEMAKLAARRRGGISGAAGAARADARAAGERREGLRARTRSAGRE
jgi:hypothetical protein